MSYSKFLFYLLLCVAITTQYSCNRDNYEEIEFQQNIEPPRYLINTSVVGFVLALDNKAISNAKVSVGNRVVYTNLEGYYEFDNVEIDSVGALVKVEKNGYEPVINMVIPKYNDLVQLNLVMQVSSRIRTIDSDQLSEITIDEIEVIVPSEALFTSTDLLHHGNAHMEVLSLGISNPLKLLPPDLRYVLTNSKSIEANHIAGIMIKVTDESGSLLKTNNSNINVTLTDESLSNKSTIKVFELNEYRNTWYEVDVIEEVGANYITINCEANKYYSFSTTTDVVSFSGRFVNQENENLTKVKYEIINELDQILFDGYSDANGRYTLNIDTREDYYIRYPDPCSESGIASQKIFENGQLLQQALSIGGYKEIQYSINPCEILSSSIEQDFLRMEIKQIGKQYNLTSNKLDDAFSIAVCDEPFKITLRNSRKIFYEEVIDPNDVEGNVIALKKKEPCNSDFGATLMIDGEEISYNENQLTIFSNPIGSNNIGITALFDIYMEIDDVLGAGEFIPNQFAAFLSSQVLECDSAEEERCSNLVAKVIEYGEVGERFKIEISGNINGVEITGVFTNIRFS